MTPKEALIKDGFPGVKAGKGRLSREAIARCSELAGQGWDIKGYQVARSSSPATAPVVTKVVPTNEKVIIDLPVVRFDKDAYKAVSETPVFGKTEFGMAEVCINCNRSLAYHVCDMPAVLGVKVKIVSK